MKKGTVITAIVAVLALTAVVTAFLSNASPYVTVAQAKNTTSDRLHLAGDLIKNSVHRDIKSGRLSFQMKDSQGETVTVVHKGETPSNLAEATQVVAIGGMSGEEFVSTQLLVKCPSKYEDERKAGGAQG